MNEPTPSDAAGLEKTITSLASHKPVMEIVRRLLAEEDFRAQFLADREAALAPYHLTPEEREALSSVAGERSLSALRKLERRILT
jgi:hypothetical protein